MSIHQPNYLPWTGLISKISQSDIFIIFDDIQLPRGKSYILRTKIKTTNGSKWITVPITDKSKFLEIKDVKINYRIDWENDHCNRIIENYKKAKYFSENYNNIEKIIKQKWEFLHELNIALIKKILEILNIQTKIVRASELNIDSKGTKKIIDLVKSVGGTEYLSGIGKGSERYTLNNEKQFTDNNIKIKYHSFPQIEYTQINGEFIPNLSIIDMMFNLGGEATLEKLFTHKMEN